MEANKQTIREAVMAEYQRASERFGPVHNSAHEAYAVMLEEAQEAENELGTLTYYLENFWRNTKLNTETHSIAKGIAEIAINTAAELVQVAAMAHKATLPYRCEGKEPDHAEQR